MFNTVLKGFFFGIGFAFALALCFNIFNWIGGPSFSDISSAESLANLPMEEKLERSTVIVRTLQSGEKAIIEDILIRDPEVDFNYKTGDEYYPMHSPGRDPRWGGDGRIILHTGLSADAVYATSYNLHDIARYDFDIESYMLAEEQ
jgi:hypothetical protein